MGMVLMFAAVIGFGIGAVGAVVGIVLFVVARKRGRGSIPIYAIISILVPVLIGAWAIFIFNQTQSTGAPSGEDYENWLKAAFIFGLAPGSGLTLGGLGLFFFSLVSPGEKS